MQTTSINNIYIEIPPEERKKTLSAISRDLLFIVVSFTKQHKLFFFVEVYPHQRKWVDGGVVLCCCLRARVFRPFLPSDFSSFCGFYSTHTCFSSCNSPSIWEELTSHHPSLAFVSNVSEELFRNNLVLHPFFLKYFILIILHLGELL
jgi:hypothetical protein